MKKRIIFCDFDGTLTDRNVTISSPVKTAIHQWITSGNLFTIATGRQFGGVIEDVCKEIGLTAPQVTMGGAEIFDPEKRKVLDAIYVDPADAHRLATVLNQQDIEYWIERTFEVFTKKSKQYPQYFGNVDFFDQKNMTLENIPKMGIFGINGEKEKFVDEKVVKDFPSLHIVKVISDIGKNWDVTNASATKHTGVLKIMELLGIAREDTIGIGDGANDFPLLAACGYKVAMGNAGESLKEIADFIAPEQKADGVAVTIEKLLR